MSTEKPKRSPRRRLAFLAGGIVLIYVLSIAFAWLASPKAVRNPAFEHYHFRMQILVDGKAENFGDKKYQVATAKDVCAANLTKEPLHFHDNKNQMVHVHWDKMTGGRVLKYYGWNYVGGIDDSLGYRFDAFPKLDIVPIHGKDLPKVDKETKFYVFTGDENGYKEHSFNDFVRSDLEDFFGQKSNVPEHSEETSLIDKLFPKASAHNGVDHGGTSDANKHEEELKELNNLIGNVVIFAQDLKPSDKQIKERFQKLEPLSDSTCAG